MLTIQKRPNEIVSLLTADFQPRYEPQFAWKSAVSQHQALPGLRGFWPTSSFDDAGDMYDLGGQGRTLTLNGDPLYGIDGLAPLILLDGVGDYFSRADEAGLDITGTESYIGATRRGLTLGGWYKFSNVAGATEYMLSKWDSSVADQRSYRLNRNVAGAIGFGVSSLGTLASVTSVTTTSSPAADEWFFGAGRFDNTNNEIEVWYNSESATAAYGNTIFSGTADFNMGARHNGNDLMTGRLSLQFLCAAALPDAVVGQLFQQTRAMFGV